MNAKTFKEKEFLIYCLPVMAVDLAIHIALYLWVSSVFYYWDPADLVMRKSRTLYFLIVSYLITAAVLPINFYQRGAQIWTTVIRSFFQTFLTLSLFAISIFALFGNFAGKLLLQDGIVASAAIITWHLIAKYIIGKARKYGRNKVHCVILGAGSNAIELYHTLAYDGQYKMLGVFSNDADLPKDVILLGKEQDVFKYMSENKIHSLYCALNPAVHGDMVNAAIHSCENLFIDFYYVPNMEGYLHRKMTFMEMGEVLVFNLRDEPLANPFNYLLKRVLDVFISGIVLVTLFPVVFIIVAAGTTISSPGPIFFKQKRTGYKGKSFTMYKFRSMKVNADADRLQATSDDPRKTKFGDFLRRTSIDELPQFINIFIGDMSIIGPRPHMELHTEMYNKLVDEYMVRHMAKPGLTGWAQVNGCRGETKEVSQMADRVRHDIWYIENWTIFLDVKIFFMTIFQVLSGDKQAY